MPSLLPGRPFPPFAPSGPAGRWGRPASPSRRRARAAPALTLGAGPAFGATQSGRGHPARASAMPLGSGGVGGGLASVVAASTVRPAVALFVPLLIIGG